MTPESRRAAIRRGERNAKHEVVDYVEREHSMNGHRCENPWAVMRMWRTGNIGFYCGECGVAIHGGSFFDELMDRWGGVQNTNPDANAYPPDHISHASFAAYIKAGWGSYHVPPDRMGGQR